MCDTGAAWLDRAFENTFRALVAYGLRRDQNVLPFAMLDQLRQFQARGSVLQCPFTRRFVRDNGHGNGSLSACAPVGFPVGGGGQRTRAFLPFASSRGGVVIKGVGAARHRNGASASAFHVRFYRNATTTQSTGKPRADRRSRGPKKRDGKMGEDYAYKDCLEGKAPPAHASGERVEDGASALHGGGASATAPALSACRICQAPREATYLGVCGQDAVGAKGTRVCGLR